MSDMTRSEAIRLKVENPDAVTERTGYWILKEITRYSHEAYYECSECGRVITLPLCRYETINSINLRLGKEYPYCNCGCRMQES